MAPMESIDDLINAIRTTSIIDNHAHPLLLPGFRSKYDILSITTEAHGDAMKATPSTLSHMRAVKQLSSILKCPATWDDVLKAIEIEQAKPDHEWEKRCFEGIETVLVDDGLDGTNEVYDYAWHDKLCRSHCKRIVRIEKMAEGLIDELSKDPYVSIKYMFTELLPRFDAEMHNAIEDPEVVGFKSVICYRTGLDIPPYFDEVKVEEEFAKHLRQLRADGMKGFKRLDGLALNAYLVDRAASIIANCAAPRKPIQFHVGLGDNDITLTKSSPSHLQPFIRKHPTVPILLLHASYPWIKEAGYLASVYENVYADIGEVFPFLSKQGQENVVREILELCPTEKLMWSTDGHWFPETYLLAIIQVREAFEKVFAEYVNDGALTVPQAVKAVQDIFFNTSNILYDLNLAPKPFPISASMAHNDSNPISAESPTDLKTLTDFTIQHPTTKFLRLHWLDHTSIPRMRLIPLSLALSIIQISGNLTISITEAALCLLQNDTIIPDVPIAGDLSLVADFTSLRYGPSPGHASLYGSFASSKDGKPSAICPRCTLQRVLSSISTQNLDFLIGFEIEVVFMSRSSEPGGRLIPLTNSQGHAWSSSRALHDPTISIIIEEIYEACEKAGFHLEMIHPESSTGQYEFVLPPYPPLQAADTLLHTREIIMSIVASHNLRATLIPKPFPSMAGTANHVHLSISSAGGENKEVYEAFWAGVLGHLRAIVAFTYPNEASYERMLDGCWAGGRWVCWGTQNKETALRKITGSHWEIKVMDGMANVYLALAAILGAGARGVRDNERLDIGDCSKDPALLSQEEREKLKIAEMLPKDLEEAMTALEDDEVMKEVLGDEVIERYVKMKEAEMNMLGKMDVDERKAWIMERY